MASATIAPGPGVSTVVVTPGRGTSFRVVERALQRAGLCGTPVRSAKEIHFGGAETGQITAALEGWEIHLHPAVQHAMELATSRRARHDRALELVRAVAQPGVAESLLAGYWGKSILDLHQIQAVAAITQPDMSGMCLFDEQGLGKTVTALFSFDRLRETGAVSLMLVIAPKNMLFEWARDAERFFGSRYAIEVVVGGEQAKRAALNRRADIFVTNFETVSRLYVKLRNVLRSHRGNVLLVVDESFFVKNSQALRTKSIKALRQEALRCLVLCGTPAPNAAQDLVEQFNIADGGIVFAGVDVPAEREAARSVVQERIESDGVFLRRLKQDVLPDLPGKTFHRVLIPMQPQQEAAYKAALGRFVENLQAVDDITFKKRIASFLAQRMALLQICSTPSSVVQGYREQPAKLLALDAILEELIAQRDEKVVVWSFFTASIDAVIERFRRYNPVRCDGQVARAEDRRDAVRRFQEDRSTMLFVANPAAAGAGITLHRARYAVYESMSNQAAHYLQSLDRIHRRGQARAVEYLVLLCDRSIEVREYDRLISKEAASQELLRDAVDPPVTRIAMLGEAVEAARLLGNVDLPRFSGQ